MIQVDLFMNNIGTSFKVLDATSDWLTFEKQDLAQLTGTPNPPTP